MGFYKILASSYRLTNIFSSKNFRKILIFLAIGLALFLLFNNSAFATDVPNGYELVDYNYSNLSYSSFGNNFTLFTSDYDHASYIFTNNNFKDLITFNNRSSGNVHVFGSNTPFEQGQVFSEIASLSAGSSASIIANFRYYLVAGANLNASGDGAFSFDLVPTYYSITESGRVANDLVDTLSVFNLWTQFGFAVPIIGVAVLFALGYMIVKKVIKGEGKSKVKF